MGPVGKNYLEISGTVLELCMTDGPVWRNMIGRRWERHSWGTLARAARQKAIQELKADSEDQQCVKSMALQALLVPLAAVKTYWARTHLKWNVNLWFKKHDLLVHIILKNVENSTLKRRKIKRWLDLMVGEKGRTIFQDWMAHRKEVKTPNFIFWFKKQKQNMIGMKKANRMAILETLSLYVFSTRKQHQT